MAFEWATQGSAYGGNLSIKAAGGLGVVGGNSPASQRIETNHTSMLLVTVGSNTAAITETITARETAVSAGSGEANAHALPWQVGYAAKTTLQQQHRMFITPNLNGCAIFVSGPAASPTVIHANCQPDIADEGLPAYASGMDPAIYGARVNEFMRSWKLPIWSDVYVTIASKLATLGLVPEADFTMLLPRDYLMDTGSAAVFGTRGSGGWSFYVNSNRHTRQFWPPA